MAACSRWEHVKAGRFKPSPWRDQKAQGVWTNASNLYMAALLAIDQQGEDATAQEVEDAIYERATREGWVLK